jgi:alkylation response protein AidB-like acyl-CoA dehydrogenase
MVHHFGSDWLKKELLPKVASGDIYFAMGYTEPSGGSDIFAAKTTATKVGEDWVINGQKMFTSSGHRSDYNLMVTRTAPDKYKGITLFFAPVKQPGYSATEIKTIGDDRTNVTFYSDLKVPDRYRLGEVNGGVKVMAMALAIEQSGGGLYIIGLRHLTRAALEWARKEGPEGRPIDDPRVRVAIAEAVARAHVTDALSRRAIWNFEVNRIKKHEGPMVKLFGSESWSYCSQKLLRMAAPDTLLRGYEGAGVIEWSARRNIAGTIYAGTSEVQRSIIAEAGLGLPRTRG